MAAKTKIKNQRTVFLFIKKYLCEDLCMYLNYTHEEWLRQKKFGTA